MHLNHLNHSADSDKLSFLVFDYNQLLYFEYNEKHDETPIDSIRMINLTPPFTSGYDVIGSSKGLVCLYGFYEYTACICNLVTREYVMLPKLNRDCDDYLSSGFGYLPIANEYKVVELFKPKGELDFTVEAAVYTLGSGNGWRIVGRLDSIIPKHYAGVFTNGFVYWKEEYYRDEALDEVCGGSRLFVFDLTEEKFHNHVSLPPEPPEAYCVWYFYFLGVLDGVLYCGIRQENESGESICFHIWVLKGKKDTGDMKKHLEHEPFGWSQEFSHLEREPFALTKGGSVLGFDYCSLGIFDAIASTSKTLVEFHDCYKILPHKITLVSLKELGEKDIKIMETARSERCEAMICR